MQQKSIQMKTRRARSKCSFERFAYTLRPPNKVRRSEMDSLVKRTNLWGEGLRKKVRRSVLLVSSGSTSVDFLVMGLLLIFVSW